ncbi:hypothetical protein [Nonomuraea sp. NPDC049400]|uniref:hypothetical protein n=1 Tax=Nonomuraea sp. NPDC049400 TaxID=3364352 RepID=UPI0037B946C6
MLVAGRLARSSAGRLAARPSVRPFGADDVTTPGDHFQAGLTALLRDFEQLTPLTPPLHVVQAITTTAQAH